MRRDAFLSALFKIVIIDLVLSGDNAVVIGMAAHRLPPRHRKFASLRGHAAAIVLRITLTAIAAFSLRRSGLQIAGGILLIWTGFPRSKQEEESHEGMKVAASMRDAVITILVADFVMNTDNALGVAAASGKDPRLPTFGLVLSMGHSYGNGQPGRQSHQPLLVAFRSWRRGDCVDGRHDDFRGSVSDAACGVDKSRCSLYGIRARHACRPRDRASSPSRRFLGMTCRHFGICGGCSLQHLSYPQQLVSKEAALLERLPRAVRNSAGVFASPLFVPTGSGTVEPWRFRQKVAFVFGSAAGGRDSSRARRSRFASDRSGRGVPGAQRTGQPYRVRASRPLGARRNQCRRAVSCGRSASSDRSDHERRSRSRRLAGGDAKRQVASTSGARFAGLGGPARRVLHQYQRHSGTVHARSPDPPDRRAEPCARDRGRSGLSHLSTGIFQTNTEAAADSRNV